MLLTKKDIPDYAPCTVELPDGRQARIDVIADESMGPPWEEHDGHGIVSEWTRRSKGPGELVLASDRGSFRYYDYAESVKIARRDGWGAEGRTAKEKAANATMQDFERLRAWCADQWQWIGVTVEIGDARDSLWGIESDSDYWREVAADLVNGLMGQAADLIAAGQVIAAEELYA